MRNLYKFLIVFAIVFTTSCKSFVDSEDIKVSKNSPLDADAQNMIQGVLIGDQFFHAGEVARIAGIYTNHFTGTDRQYVSLNNWNLATAADMDGAWGNAYWGVISQAKSIQAKADKEVNPTIKGVAQIVEAHTMGTIAALWGDVPYSQVANIEKFPNPTYDKQSDVYSALQKLLDDAIANLAKGIGSVNGKKDIFYNGDVTKWTALANSLKARFYLHVKDYPNANKYAALGIKSAAGDLNANFGISYGSSFNPFYSFLVYDRSGYMGATDAYAPTIMDPGAKFANKYGGYTRNHSKHNEGDRFNWFYITYQFYASGYEPNYFSNYDGWGSDGAFGTETNMPLVTYGEMLLIQAEYETRTNGLSAGVTAYNKYRQLINTGYGFTKGATPSFSFPDYVDADFENGGVENKDNIDSSKALLREIYEERYVIFTGNLESFNDIRRTDNIAEVKFKAGFAGKPERLLYPQTEVNSNKNVPNPLPKITDPTPVNK